MDYTKGEWKVWWRNPDDKGDSDCRIVADGEDVAIVLAHDLNECEASAHLIAAAAEMYEALKELVSLWDEEGFLSVEGAREALAKAERKEK